MKNHSIAVTLLVLSLPLLGGVAFAAGHDHNTRHPKAAEQAGSGMMMMGCMGPMSAISQRTDGVLAFLEVELKIASSQREAWDEFADAFRDAKGDGRMRAPGRGMMEHGDETQSLPDRMAEHAKMMDKHLARLKALHAPTARLYDVLDAGQQKTADELVPAFLMCRMM